MKGERIERKSIKECLIFDDGCEKKKESRPDEDLKDEREHEEREGCVIK